MGCEGILLKKGVVTPFLSKIPYLRYQENAKGSEVKSRCGMTLLEKFKKSEKFHFYQIFRKIYSGKFSGQTERCKFYKSENFMSKFSRFLTNSPTNKTGLSRKFPAQNLATGRT